MRGRKSFTLVEVMLALSITALFVALIGGSLSATLTGARAVKAGARVRDEGGAILRLISLDLSSAMWVGQGAESLLGEDASRGGLPADSIHMVTASQPLALDGVPSEVSYFLRENILLRRESRPVDRVTTQGGAAVEVSSSALGLDFQYFDGETWRDSWSAEAEGALPLAVRAELVLAGGDATPVQHFSRIIPIISGSYREKS